MKTKTKRKKFRGSPSSSQSNDSPPSDLHTAVVRIAVAQICNSVGYTSTQTSALETLTDVAVKYLQSLATSAVTSANSTGRTECNLYDVIRALEDLHADVGFIGNSDINRRLYKLTDSSILRDTMKFVYSTREIPFAKPLPRRCQTVTANSPCFSIESGEWKHIPRWLPEFPKVGDGGGDTVARVSECENNVLTVESSCEISKLMERRKKVSFRIEIKCGVDFRRGICKGRKRVLCEIYDSDDDDDDDDDERVVNNHEVKVKQYVRKRKKKKLEDRT